MRDAQIGRLLRALTSEKRRVESAGDELQIAISVFPSLAPILEAARRELEATRGGLALEGRPFAPQPATSPGGGLAESARGRTAAGILWHGQPGVDARRGTGAEDTWLLPPRQPKAASLVGRHAAPAWAGRGPGDGPRSVARLGPPRRPSSGGEGHGERPARDAELDLRPVNTDKELVVAPWAQDDGHTPSRWLASDNAYGAGTVPAPALRPGRARSTSGLHRSMSSSLAPAQALEASLRESRRAKMATMGEKQRVGADGPFRITAAIPGPVPLVKTRGEGKAEPLPALSADRNLPRPGTAQS